MKSQWVATEIIEELAENWELIEEPTFFVMHPFGKGKIGVVYIPKEVLATLDLVNGESVDVAIRKHKTTQEEENKQ